MSNPIPNKRLAVLSRLKLVVMKLARSSKPVAAHVIAKDCGVSDKTICRDIETLNNLGFETRVTFGREAQGFSMDRCNCPFCGSRIK
jgi:predicted DNA-binding transcriptional regulator YafY